MRINFSLSTSEPTEQRLSSIHELKKANLGKYGNCKVQNSLPKVLVALGVNVASPSITKGFGKTKNGLLKRSTLHDPHIV